MLGFAQRVVAAALALSVSACGLTMTKGPDPHRPTDQRPVCTETMDAPKRDAIGAIAGFLGVMTGLLFLKVDDNESVGVPLIVGGVVVVAASYASVGIGYFRVKRCKKAIEEYERRPRSQPR